MWFAGYLLLLFIILIDTIQCIFLFIFSVTILLFPTEDQLIMASFKKMSKLYSSREHWYIPTEHIPIYLLPPTMCLVTLLSIMLCFLAAHPCRNDPPRDLKLPSELLARWLPTLCEVVRTVTECNAEPPLVRRSDKLHATRSYWDEKDSNFLSCSLKPYFIISEGT